MALVKFYRGERENYNKTLHADGIYFATDTKEIVMNDAAYGYNAEDHSEIADVEYTAPDTIKITYTNGESDTVTLQTAEAGDTAAESKAGLISKNDIYKLAKVEAGAQVNKIEIVKVNGVALDITDKSVNIDLSDINNALKAQKITAADKSVTVIASDEGTTVKVTLDPNGKINLTDNGLAVDQAALTQYTGKEAIVVTGDETGKEIALKLDAANKILSQGANGLLATLGLDFASKATLTESENSVIQLKGVGGVVISELDAEKFLMDRVLGGVDLTGSKLTFTFKVEHGEDESLEDIEIDLADYIKVYTAGNGISITNNVVAVKLKEGETYLEVTEDGLATKGIDTAIENAINELDLDTVGGTGKYVKSVSQENGQVSAEAADLNDAAVALTASGFTGNTVKAAAEELLAMWEWHEG